MTPMPDPIPFNPEPIVVSAEAFAELDRLFHFEQARERESLRSGMRIAKVVDCSSDPSWFRCDSIGGRLGRFVWLNSDPAGVTQWAARAIWGRVSWNGPELDGGR